MKYLYVDMYYGFYKFNRYTIVIQNSSIERWWTIGRPAAPFSPWIFPRGERGKDGKQLFLKRSFVCVRSELRGTIAAPPTTCTERANHARAPSLSGRRCDEKAAFHRIPLRRCCCQTYSILVRSITHLYFTSPHLFFSGARTIRSTCVCILVYVCVTQRQLILVITLHLLQMCRCVRLVSL